MKLGAFKDFFENLDFLIFIIDQNGKISKIRPVKNNDLV